MCTKLSSSFNVDVNLFEILAADSSMIGDKHVPKKFNLSSI